MLKAGKAVDQFIDQLLPYLDKGDLIIDGGNSNHRDTGRRMEALEQKGFLYIGTGVSGGEEGALRGPSIMPGGSDAAWSSVAPIFTAIAARAQDNSPCVSWMGPGGAGHFVKMVHNGIEYGDMQLICEVYHAMRTMLGMNAAEMHAVFDHWQQGPLNSYLIEITRDILIHIDEEGAPLLEKILDCAGQKGTGRWAVNDALAFGTPLSLISESVFSRCLSHDRELRLTGTKALTANTPPFTGDRDLFIDRLEMALYCAKVISYTQGFSLLRAAASNYGWPLDYGDIARIWRGGCIIRSIFLDRISEAFQENPALENLLFADSFRKQLANHEGELRRVISEAVLAGIPMPCHSAALAYYDGLRCEALPANLLQAQRDYFGAHMYERTDQPRGKWFHTNWTGSGGSTTSTTYSG
jgi:6-phosphogluconate dehydrogenase